MFLQSALSGEKNVRALFILRKKYVAEKEDAKGGRKSQHRLGRFPVDFGFNVALRVQRKAPWRALMAPWGLFTLYVRSTLGNLPT